MTESERLDADTGEVPIVECERPAHADGHHGPECHDWEAEPGGVDELELQRVEVIDVRPNDVIVVTVATHIDDQKAGLIRTRLASRFRENRVVIVNDLVRLDVYRPAGHECQLCPQSFERPQDLTRHYIDEHGASTRPAAATEEPGG